MTSTPRLIALSSPAMGSGKSTVAEHLVAAHGFHHVAFATALKNMTCALLESLGMDYDEIEDRVYGSRKEEVIPVLDITSRRLQQLLGTEFGRDCIRPSIWVDITAATVQRHLDAGHSVVIDDMRFPNEYEAVLALGGTCWRIHRPGVAVTATHASEGQLDRIEMFTLINAAGIEDLHAVVDRLVEGV